VGGDTELAIRLYEQNTLLAESLYGVLQGLEVSLRNRIHAQLAAGYRRAEWWDAVNLEPEQRAMLRKAKDSPRPAKYGLLRSFDLSAVLDDAMKAFQCLCRKVG
jgi:hypothetical protein